MNMANQQLSAEQQKLAELEIEMMADMFNRMTKACRQKCIPTRYSEAELTKAEGVCVDRCVNKYMEIHELIGKRLSELTMSDENAMKAAQAAQQGTS